MPTIFAYAIVIFIPILFLSAISYYVVLFILKNKLKRHGADIWADFRNNAKPFESELATTYKIIMDRRAGQGMRSSERALAKAAKCNLYVSMSLFMVALAVGLYASVNK
ncbi:hypothetical protein [Dyella mobilis]|uniref:Uncharacterized protein n=1 Tax=Dyella mobilis TaxID=1849582 RepID=A0ABS2KIC8_9GAMM|nr:hypothetical protein [Dyella mobilis]MBM7130645.1 hypothetical protein [Dyella mobilis]GLQ97272.1 hypothetical protein GCM10007863_16920 [Dyella mobilis]